MKSSYFENLRTRESEKKFTNLMDIITLVVLASVICGTDLIPYSGTFDTSDAAMTIHNNAEAAGLRCAFVSVSFAGSSKSYALNEFVVSDMTTPLYVDSVNLTTKTSGGSDTYVDLGIGKPYVRKDIYNTASTYPIDSSYGNVTNITTIWHT